MPYYQFTILRDSLNSAEKARVAAAFTEAHVSVTGAPGHLVTCSFVEVGPDSFFEGGKTTSMPRLVGTIRRRPEASKRALITALSEAWSTATGQSPAEIVIFLVEIPGYQAFEQGVLLEDTPEYLAESAATSLTSARTSGNGAIG